MKALLFDVDGTLIDSVPLWTEANLHALKTRDFVMDEQTFVTRIYQHGLHYHGMLEACGMSTERSEEFYRNRDDLYEMLLQKHVEWMGAAGDVLKHCASMVPVGMMTGSKKRYIDAIDAKLHLTQIFRASVTYDDTGTRMKPDPYGLALLTEKMSIHPADCIYVGDQLVDVRAARAAGMQSCLIPNKSTPHGAEHEADIVLKDIGEIRSLLNAVS